MKEPKQPSPGRFISDPSPAWNRFMGQNTSVERYLSAVHSATLEDMQIPVSIPQPGSEPPKRLGLSSLLTSRFVDWTFPRDDVMQGRVGRSVDRLMALSDDPANCMHMHARLVLKFEGLQTDPREVHQIPECVEFMRSVHQQWPYWLHFMAPVPDNLRVLLLMLCDSQLATQGVHTVTARIHDPHQARTLLRHMRRSMAVLHAQCGLSQSFTDYVYRNVMNQLPYVTRV